MVNNNLYEHIRFALTYVFTLNQFSHKKMYLCQFNDLDLNVRRKYVFRPMRTT